MLGEDAVSSIRDLPETDSAYNESWAAWSARLELSRIMDLRFRFLDDEITEFDLAAR
jgi:hypothetical protein